MARPWAMNRDLVDLVDLVDRRTGLTDGSYRQDFRGGIGMLFARLIGCHGVGGIVRFRGLQGWGSGGAGVAESRGVFGRGQRRRGGRGERGLGLGAFAFTGEFEAAKLDFFAGFGQFASAEGEDTLCQTLDKRHPAGSDFVGDEFHPANKLRVMGEHGHEEIVGGQSDGAHIRRILGHEVDLLGEVGAWHPFEKAAIPTYEFVIGVFPVPYERQGGLF